MQIGLQAHGLQHLRRKALEQGVRSQNRLWRGGRNVDKCHCRIPMVSRMILQMRMTPNKFCMNHHTHRFPLRATASAVMVAALGTAALAQEGTALPSVTVQSTRASATLPLRSTAQAEREKLDKVPGGTNLAEPQKEARLATLRDALDYQPGIVLQDFFGGTDQPRLGIRGSGIQ